MFVICKIMQNVWLYCFFISKIINCHVSKHLVYLIVSWLWCEDLLWTKIFEQRWFYKCLLFHEREWEKRNETNEAYPSRWAKPKLKQWMKNHTSDAGLSQCVVARKKTNIFKKTEVYRKCTGSMIKRGTTLFMCHKLYYWPVLKEIRIFFKPCCNDPWMLIIGRINSSNVNCDTPF